MSDKRQIFIDKVIEILSGITEFQSIGDFETNWDAETEFPALSVFDGTVNHDLANAEPEASSQINTLNLTLQIFVKSGTRAATVRVLIQKVREKVKANRTWEDLAMWTMPGTTSIEVERTHPENGSFEIIGASLNYEVAIMSDSFDF